MCVYIYKLSLNHLFLYYYILISNKTILNKKFKTDFSNYRIIFINHFIDI